MELCLNWEELNYYEPVGPIAISGEEAVELPIPDYCPDVARIVDTVGRVQVREKIKSEGKVLLRGSIQVTVLYTSEESGGLRSLDLTVPFTSQTDEKRLQECRTVWVEERLLLCEAKTVTARKIYVRVIPEFLLTGYASIQRRLCTEIEGENLCQRRQEMHLQHLIAVEERELTFSQELLPENREDWPDDILAERMTLQILDSQQVGSRMVVKGEAQLSILYRSEGQKLCHCRQTVPFSQIIDGIPTGEGAICHVEARLRDCEVRMLRTDMGSSFALSARVNLLIHVHRERSVTWVADAYSTSHRSKLRREQVRVLTEHRNQILQDTVRENWELGDTAFVWLETAECSPVQVMPEHVGVQLRSTLRLKLLYLDDNGTPISTERSVEVEVQSPQIPESVRVCCGEGRISRMGNSWELQLPVEFCTDMGGQAEVSTVSGMELLKEGKREQMPSLILRRMRPEEDLWDIAKQYQSREELIRSVNELENNSCPVDGMLMIPKVR